MLSEKQENSSANLTVKKSRTVILFGWEDLLATSIEILLSNKKEWEVIQIYDKTNVDFLMGEISKVKPDVVILCQDDNLRQQDLPWQLMQIYSQLKVITISLENNAVGIYNKMNVWIREVPDLIAVIDSQ